jgi:peptidoglycan/LPS O-acetylase OafA/YrhL
MKQLASDRANRLDFAVDLGRIPSLDGLRAISILLVLFGHFLLPANIRGIGAFGVTIFFFISGFLITRLLFAEMKRKGRISISAFYLRRILRLYPVIIAAVGVCTLFAVIRGDQLDPIELQSVFFYFTNYLVFYRDIHGIPLKLPIGPFWSLSVEEHFYLIFPGIFVLVQGRPKHVIQIAIATCIGCLALRCTYLLLWPEWIGTLATYWRSETRFDSIAFGVLLAAMCEMRMFNNVVAILAKPKFAIAATVALAASFVFRHPFYQDTFRFTIQGLSLLPIVACAVFSNQALHFRRLLNSSIMVWIGKLSYSLYIWHGAVIFMLAGFSYAYLPEPIHGTLYLIVSFIAAALSYYLLELPFMKLRHRLER